MIIFEIFLEVCSSTGNLQGRQSHHAGTSDTKSGSTAIGIFRSSGHDVGEETVILRDDDDLALMDRRHADGADGQSVVPAVVDDVTDTVDLGRRSLRAQFQDLQQATVGCHKQQQLTLNYKINFK